MEEPTSWRVHLAEELICEKDTHICLQIQVLLFALVFLLVIVRGRMMGKLVSIVMTCLVVLSSRFQFWKNWQKRWPHDGPSWARRTVAGSRFETLRKSEIGYWKLTLWTSWRNGRTDRHRLFREIESLNSVTSNRTDRRRRDGPSQTAKSQSGSDFFTRFKGRFGLFLLYS